MKRSTASARKERDITTAEMDFFDSLGDKSAIAFTQKQSPNQTCVCGQVIEFPEGQVRATCQTRGCGVIWELGTEGFWYMKSLPLSPILEVMAGKRRKPNHYERYMAKRKDRKGC